METVTVTICNWEKYNDRKDVKKASWLRLENETYSSESLYGLTAEEKWAWVCMLMLASKRHTPEITFRTDWFEYQMGVKPKVLISAVEKLARNNAILCLDGNARENVPADSRARENMPATDGRTNERTDDIRPVSKRIDTRPNSLPSEFTGVWVYDRLTEGMWAELNSVYDDPEWVEDECRKMAVWLSANTNKARKTPKGWCRFITAWLNRSWDSRRVTA